MHKLIFLINLIQDERNVNSGILYYAIGNAYLEEGVFEKAFEYLLEEGYPAVNVVWASGKRMDHTLNNFHSLVRYGRKLKIVFFDDYSTSYLLPPTFEKWYPAGTPLSLIPYGEAFQVKSSGLVYDLNHPELRLGTQTSSSNEAREDGIVKISYESGSLILMECHD